MLIVTIMFEKKSTFDDFISDLIETRKRSIEFKLLPLPNNASETYYDST